MVEATQFIDDKVNDFSIQNTKSLHVSAKKI